MTLPRRPLLRLHPRPLRALAAAALAVLATGCNEMLVERADPNIEKARVDRDAVKSQIDVDPIMRGTVAAETALVGFEPVVVRGYGLVVGLRGTGSRQMPADVRAYLTQEFSKRGFGSGTPGAPRISAQQLLNTNDTAVVIVEGVIPPGTPKGGTFDVRIFAAPGTSTTSLEGGRLLIADLRPGPLFTGSRQPFPLAEASGPIVINPFVEPNATQRDTISRTSGRILDGGHANKDMLLRLRLYTSSHSRAETIQNSVNALFPRERGQRVDTARGRSGDTVDLAIPPSYWKRTAEFAELIRHAPLNIENPEQTAMSVRRALLANPGAARAASWRWQALGKKALPMIQDLYEYPEEQPRLAALDAGAKLDDMLAVPHLLSMAKESASMTYRTQALKLLGRMGTNPEIDIGLREMLNDKDVDIRLAAFEALDARGDTGIVSVEVGNKYTVNICPSSHPMVYVTQSGKPKIVIFDESLSIKRPMTVVAWSNRLIMKADEGDDLIQVRYQEREDAPPVNDRVKADLLEFVSFLGRRATVDRPESGLNFSYSETISALHALWREKYLACDFRAEQDRILADILREDKTDADRRPELAGDSQEDGTEGTSTDLLSGARTPRSDLESASVGSGLDATKARKDTVPR
ncbi:MAG: flagellar basal body P-ring protein FlgI [Phycisphaerales bacterium]